TPDQCRRLRRGRSIRAHSSRPRMGALMTLIYVASRSPSSSQPKTAAGRDDARERTAPMKQPGGEISRRIVRTAALALLLAVSSEAKSAPANSLRELYAALGECVKAPVGAPGS